MANSSSRQGDPPKSRHPSAPRALLNLPQEIKNTVYKYVFDDAQLVIAIGWTKTRSVTASATYHLANRSATMVSKQMRKEALPVLLPKTLIIIQSAWSLMTLLRSHQSTEVFSAAKKVKLNLTTPARSHWPSLAAFKDLQTLHVDIVRHVKEGWGSCKAEITGVTQQLV